MSGAREFYGRQVGRLADEIRMDFEILFIYIHMYVYTYILYIYIYIYVCVCMYYSDHIFTHTYIHIIISTTPYS